MTERESKVQGKIISICKKYGAYIYKNAQNMYTERGRPDLTACIPTDIKTLIDVFGEDKSVGLFVTFEVKRDGLCGNTSLSQEVVGRKIQDAKGIWLVVDDPDVVEALMIKLKGE